MNKFINLFIEETEFTIERLTGVKPKIKFLEEMNIYNGKTLIPPAVKINLLFNNGLIGKSSIMIPSTLANSLGDMMLGGEGDITKEIMDNEDIDCSIEIVDNIIGCINTEITNNEKLPHFVISTSKGEFFDVDRPIELDSYSKLYVLSFEMENIKSIIYFNMNIDSINFISDSGWGEKINMEDKENHIEDKPEENSFETISERIKNRTGLKDLIFDKKDYEEEINDKKGTIMDNESLLNDIEVNVKILVGSQILTLEELKNLKENSTIELNQLANSPLTIFVNNVPYGQGEVVVVDGMYGVQITKLYTKEDVYHV